MPISQDDSIADLITFLRRWWRIGRKPCRIPDSEIPADVPPALRTVYSTIGNWPVPHDQQDQAPDWRRVAMRQHNRLFHPHQLQVTNRRMTFAEECQSLWVAEFELGREDPGVQIVYDRGQESEECFAAQRLSHFLVTFALNELVHGSGYRLASNCRRSALDRFLSSDWQRLWDAEMLADPEWKHDFHTIDHSAVFLSISSPAQDRIHWLCNVKSKRHRIYDAVSRFAAS